MILARLRAVSSAIFFLALLISGCKKVDNLKIVLPFTEYSNDVSLPVSAEHPYLVKSYEWKILELDSVVSTDKSFNLHLKRTGSFTLQLTVRAGISRKITKSVVIKITAGWGKIGSYWNDMSGGKRNISIWAKGTTITGAAYKDSSFTDFAIGSNFPNNDPCSFLVQLRLPPGNYTYWYQYCLTCPGGPESYSKGTGTVTINGNCVDIF
ncbi:MAG: hypothetical protein ACK5CV_09565 [Bacteroidota bacterium]|jgi:hypothetical protein